jgi:hypothetical protein
MPGTHANKKVAVAGTEVPRAEAPRIDPAQAEHIFIASDEAPDPRSAGHTVRQRWRLANPLRRELTEVTLFDEGYLEVVERARGRGGEPFRLDLHYLDPIPSISRFIAKRAWWTTAGCAAAAIAALALSSLGPLVVSFALAAGAAALGAAAIALHRSHEKTEFFTIHGRARVLVLRANFGAIKPMRTFVPELSRAIEEAAEKITDDTSAYLRAEMREHYRLRGDGVLSPETCAESTGRILAQFDVQL